jgi:hypothetical protein
MEVLILLTAGAMCIACFIIGAKVGQSVAKGEKIETPSLPTIKLVKKHDDDKEAETERKRLDTIMRNIERYDGTGRGQEDVPR